VLAGIDAKEDPKVKRVRDKRTALLKEKLTEEQVARYDVYRSAGFSKTMVKRTMQNAGASSALAETCVIVLSGITKVFVGEVVELGAVHRIHMHLYLSWTALTSHSITLTHNHFTQHVQSKRNGATPVRCSRNTCEKPIDDYEHRVHCPTRQCSHSRVAGGGAELVFDDWIIWLLLE
jgi:hypothetical protein